MAGVDGCFGDESGNDGFGKNVEAVDEERRDLDFLGVGDVSGWESEELADVDGGLRDRGGFFQGCFDFLVLFWLD